MTAKKRICSPEDFKVYLETHSDALLHRNGACRQCSYKNRCGESIKWNLNHRLSKKPPTTENRIRQCFCRILPGAFLRPLFVKEFLPCSHTAIEILEEKEEIFRLLRTLDHKSAEALVCLLMYRITGDDAYTSAADCKEEQYFIEPFRNLTGEEVVVDCGAFTGDTLEAYIKNNAPPKRYYLYETKAEYIAEIQAAIKRLSAEQYAVVRAKGVWSHPARLWFSPGKHGGAGGGFVSETKGANSEPVDVVSLDADISGPVSFIKMDIEGAEVDALLGADRLIRSFKPRLAICIYHRTTDLWRIPLSLIDRYPFYENVIIRHHKHHSVGDTVLYLF